MQEKAYQSSNQCFAFRIDQFPHIYSKLVLNFAIKGTSETGKKIFIDLHKAF